MLKYKLRPHHGLCILFFEGKGYSDSFAQNMSDIIEKLCDTEQIELTLSADCICACCPNNQNGLCKAQKKVLRYDRKVLELCGFEDKQSISYGVFKEAVTKNIILSGKLKTVCGNCQWSDICNETILASPVWRFI